MPTEQYEVQWKDYYELLGVRPDADQDTITRVWRRLSQVYHPDTTVGAAVDPERMKELNTAYEILSDPQRRYRYDQYRRSRANLLSDNGIAQGWVDRIAARALGLWRIEGLVDRISPSPDESQRVLPWPSWKWQRLALLGAVALALVLTVISLLVSAWALFVMSFAWAVASILSGVFTGWLRTSRDAPTPAKVGAGASILASEAAYLIGIISVIITTLLMILFYRASRALLEDLRAKRRLP